MALSVALAVPASAADYDLVILNGRVIGPETMLDAKLNVGVKDGEIAIITGEEITGRETIDAAGLAMARTCCSRRAIRAHLSPASLLTSSFSIVIRGRLNGPPSKTSR